MKDYINTIKVGLFLTRAQISRAGKLTTSLTISVMVFTFLAQIFISGILMGLIEGSSVQFRKSYIGDLIISNLDEKPLVERSSDLMATLVNNEKVSSYSPRYTAGARVEANYTKRASDEVADTVSTSVQGINPDMEQATTKLSENIVEGEYLLNSDPPNYIMIGAGLLDRYSQLSDVISLLKDVRPGDTVRVTVNGRTEEFIVKGVIKSKVDFIQNAIFMRDTALMRLTGNLTSDVNSIAVRARTQGEEYAIKEDLIRDGFDTYAKIQTYDEAEPSFVKNIKNLFGVLGNMFGSITLVVAAITVFIIIFINAITRRKYIGILKGIGIDGRAIELAYVLQSVFYAAIGIAVGSVLTFALIKPFFDAHPINFPFSDGVLVATASGTFWRGMILLAISVVAAYYPARMIIKQNTLDAILGRPATKVKRESKWSRLVKKLSPNK